MNTQLLRFLPWLFPCLFAVAATGTEGEMGLPRTAVYEAVMADLVFQRSSPLTVESQLVIVNSVADSALLELELFFEGGGSAAAFFTEGVPKPSNLITWESANELMLSEETGRFYRVVDPHSLIFLDFPGEGNPLSARDFSGWALLRSNRPLTVFQRTLLSGASGERFSELNRTASLGPTTSGRVLVGSFRCEIYTTIPSFSQIGWRVGTSGVAVTNPLDADLMLRFELLDLVETLTIDPRSKEAFLIGELFPSYLTSGCSLNDELRITSGEGRGFVASAVGIEYYTDLEGRPMVFGSHPPLEFSHPFGFRMPVERDYEFPEEILQQLSLGEHLITLTRFGFSIRSGGEPASDRVYPLHIGGTSREVVGIDSPTENDLAVIYGGLFEVALVFASGKVEVVPYGGCCRTPEYERLEGNLLRITLGYPCALLRMVVDPVEERLVSRELVADPDVFCF